MKNRRRINEVTTMGGEPLEYLIYGAALKCQSRKAFRCLAYNCTAFLNIHLLEQSSILETATIQKTTNPCFVLASSWWRNVSCQIVHFGFLNPCDKRAGNDNFTHNPFYSKTNANC